MTNSINFFWVSMWGVNIVTLSIVGIFSFSAYFYYYHLFFYFVEMTLTPIWILAINVCLCSCQCCWSWSMLRRRHRHVVYIFSNFWFSIYKWELRPLPNERMTDWRTGWASEWIVSLDFNNWQFGWLCPSRFMSMSTHICLSDCLTACLTVS